jgi:hypothetical protein
MPKGASHTNFCSKGKYWFITQPGFLDFNKLRCFIALVSRLKLRCRVCRAPASILQIKIINWRYNRWEFLIRTFDWNLFNLIFYAPSYTTGIKGGVVFTFCIVVPEAWKTILLMGSVCPSYRLSVCLSARLNVNTFFRFPLNQLFVEIVWRVKGIMMRRDSDFSKMSRLFLMDFNGI